MHNTFSGGGVSARRSARLLVPLLAIGLLAIALHTPATADSHDVLVDMRFNGNFTDVAGGSTVEVFTACPGDPCNSVSEFGTDSDGTFWRWESTNPRGGGFRLTTTEALGHTYTVGLRFRFDEVGLGDDASSWRKIIDYKNRAEDTGFYFYEGAIEFYPYDESAETFAPGELLDLLAVRQGSEGSVEGTFTVYAIGEDGSTTPVLTITDTVGDSIPATSGGGSLLGFFFDDVDTPAEGTPGGKVYSLRIWDRALDPTEVVDALDDTEEATEEATEEQATEEATEEQATEDVTEDVTEVAQPVRVDAGTGGLLDSGFVTQLWLLAGLLVLALLAAPLVLRGRRR